MSEKIKQRRLQLNMTLEEVGAIVGVSKSTVLKWENGDIANMRRDKIALLAKALHVSPAYLMGWDNSAPEMPAPEDEQMKEFIRLFGKLTDQQRRSLIALMQSMIAARE